MSWSPPISSEDVVAIHAALLPTANGDGEVLLFGGDNHERRANEAHRVDHSRRFNCRNPTAPLIYVHSPAFDLFCCGHAFLGDGRLLVAGGTAEFPAGAHGAHHELGHFEGHRHATVYNSATGNFTNVADMNPEPGHTTGGGRWYPTLCTLGSGEVFAFQGHPEGNDTRHGNNTPERYQSLTNSWALLPPVGDVGGAYSRLHLLRDGSLFASSRVPGYGRNIVINPYTGETREVAPLPDGAYHGFACPSVLLPLVPEDGYTPRILLAGGRTSQLLDLGAGSPTWQNVTRSGSTAGEPRWNACATLLPTGDVVITGGTRPDRPETPDPNDATDQTAVTRPELYRTPLSLASGSYTGGVGSWTTLEDPASVLRNYHSTALLLPDGRVWTAGGNAPGQPEHPDGEAPPAHKNIELFSPPYPAGARPRITACPSFIGYGDTFNVSVSNASRIVRAVLMRCGSSTHAFDVDQRAVLLNFGREGNTLMVTAPPHGNVAPPSQYMLFVIDRDGRPCEYARFIRVGGQLSMFTNRSHYSLREVQALGSPATIPSALYVVLDGFCAADLASGERPFPPSVRFHRVDNGQVVPGVTADLIDTLYEAPSAPPNVAQRITLAYNVRFADTHAFEGIPAGDQRDVRVSVQWGPTQAEGLVHLLRREHVYALDGPVSWLSVDLRVTRLTRGSMLAGVRNDAPIPFVQAALTRLRTAANDEFHPFTSLGTTDAASVLELAPSVGGTAVDNFAFAKVRFRAPAGIDAHDVKVLFRLFTTAGSHLDYDEATTYPRFGIGAGAVALEGRIGSEVISIPFFASARISNEAAQPDPSNVVTLHGGGATEVVAYFGCWLDFNHNTSIRNKLRGAHQCLVAEIHYPPSAIPHGATPSNNDQLSQRNLAIIASDNPGGPAAHTVAQTFELRRLPLAFQDISTHVSRLKTQPDDLFIHWHDLPRDTLATLYLPGLDVGALLNSASLRPGMGSLAQVDEHTVRCQVGDVSYLPLFGHHEATLDPIGLITLQLPPTVRTGERYRVSLHQISGITRAITGSFELSIPVSRADLMVDQAQRELGVLRQIGNTLALTDRWTPVFSRYLGVLADRVRALGGNSEAPPEGEPDGHQPGQDHDHHPVTGKVRTILYDGFGDFEGFILENCDGTRRFSAHEHHLHTVIHEAATARLTVYVEPHPKEPSRACQVRLMFV